MPPNNPAAGTNVNAEGIRKTSNLVPEAPTLPAPKIPRAVPLLWSGNQAEHQAMPTVNEFPANPKSAEQISNCPYEDA